MNTQMFKFFAATSLVSLVACGGGNAAPSRATQRSNEETAAQSPLILADSNLQVADALQAQVKLTYGNLSAQDLAAHVTQLPQGSAFASFRLNPGIMSTSFGQGVDAFLPTTTLAPGDTVLSTSSFFYVVMEPSTNMTTQTVAGPFTIASVVIPLTSVTSARTLLIASAYDASVQLEEGGSGLFPSRSMTLVTFVTQLNSVQGATELLRTALNISQRKDSGPMDMMLTIDMSSILQEADALVAAP